MDIKSTINALRHMAPFMILTYLRQKITGKEFFISGTCHQCGQCCRLINLKYYKGWIRTERQFKELISIRPEYGRFSIVSKDQMGYLQFTCSWIDELHGCREYENRLDICKRYPSKSLLLFGGRLLKDCGYSITEVQPFKKHLTSEIQKKQNR